MACPRPHHLTTPPPPRLMPLASGAGCGRIHSTRHSPARFEPSGGLQRLRGAFAKTMVFHNQDGYLLRTKEDGVWVHVNLTVSRLHVPPRPLGLIIARDDRERRNAL